MECFYAESILIVEINFNFSETTHKIQYICELPPLYEIERGSGVSKKSLNKKMRKKISLRRGA